jgi:hypothetical protein
MTTPDTIWAIESQTDEAVKKAGARFSLFRQMFWKEEISF